MANKFALGFRGCNTGVFCRIQRKGTCSSVDHSFYRCVSFVSHQEMKESHKMLSFRLASIKRPLTELYKRACLNVAASEVSYQSFSSGQCISTEKNACLVHTGGNQTTLASPVELHGIGLHHGNHAKVRLVPGLAGEGRYFVLNGDEENRISATVENVCMTRLSTTLGRGLTQIWTVEHLMSALEGKGVDNLRIEVYNGDEMPILDGSAKLWVDAIESVGIVEAADPSGNPLQRFRLAPNQPITVQENDAFVTAYPSQKQVYEYGIDFPQLPVVGRQKFSWSPTYNESNLSDNSYKEEISMARTFGIKEQIDQLRAGGLIKGGSLENALVCSMSTGWVNPPLRYSDEPCRHKLLDLIGDLGLCGKGGNPGTPLAHIVAYKASHSLHVQFAAKLLQACGDSTPLSANI